MDTGRSGAGLDVLLIEDNPGDARLFEELLSESELTASHRWESSLGEGLQAAVDRRPSVVVVDLGLPDSQGTETVVRITERLPETPLVVLTGRTGLDTATAALDAGASEYLQKEGLTPTLLARTLRLAVERQRLEREAARQRSVSHSILQSLPEHVVVLSPDGTILTVNDSWIDFARSEGGDPRGYEGDNYLRTTERAAEEGSEDALRMSAGLRAVLAGDEHQFSMEYPCHGPDEKRWFRVEVVPLSGYHEGGAVVSHVDITERKLAELGVEAERARLREVFDQAPAYIATLRGPNHVYEMVNPAYRELLPDRDLIGRPGREAVPEAVNQGYFEILDEVYESGEPYRAEEMPIDLAHPDGTTERVYRNFVYQPRSEDGEVVGVIAHGVDVTEQVEARKQAEAAERRYRTLVETMAEATVILNAEGRITFSNEEAEDLLGLEKTELIDRSYSDPEWAITGPDGGSFPDEKLPFRRVMDTGRAVRNVEHGIRHPDGAERVLSINAAPLAAEEGDRAGVVTTIRDVTERKRMEEELRHRALHDELTDLPNRNLFDDRLRQALTRGRRHEELVGLLMLDVDRFKQINDHMGHAAGDRVLTELAERLQQQVRAEDTAARLGGDEFALLVPGLEGLEDLVRIRDRILETLSERFRVGGELVEVDVTIGAVLQASDGVEEAVTVEEPDDLLRYADLALFEAKRAAGPSFHLFDPADDLEHTEMLGREQELRRGIRDEEFELFFQPMYRLEDGGVWGVEPLARWRHPERGLLSPAEFIPLAEETGLIHELGDLLFREACRHAADWPEAGGRPVRITPNISGRQFSRAGLSDRFRSCVEEAGLAPGRFWLEVTESAITRATGEVAEVRGHGFGVLVDDFGTGFSSFHYLRDLALDGLKIDMSFVQGIGEDATSRGLVETMITMGQTMDLRVVAEGIETEEQREALDELGCGLGQGFLLSRPMPAGEIKQIIADHDAGS